jgi:hypothetical protein
MTDKPKRRWFQFSLRGLMLLVLAVGIGLGWWTFRRNEQLRREQRIDRAVQLLGECPDPLGIDYNPVPLIRAVNHLHSMGQADAIKVLRRVEAEEPISRAQESLQLVIPLLFTAKDPEDPLPFSSLGGKGDLQKDPWGNWINVEGDIPFHTKMIQAYSGPTMTDSGLVEWAERQGRLRTTPLRPADDLIGAADAMIQRLQADEKDKSGEYHWTRYHIRQQVYAALEPILPKRFSHESISPDDEAAWSELKKQCQTLKLHWNEEQQSYVFSVSQADNEP